MKVLEEVKAKLEELFDSFVDEFTATLNERDAMEIDDNVNKFFESKEFEHFKSNAVGRIVKAKELDDNELTEILKAFRLNDMLEFILKGEVPMPSSNPPAGQKWTKQVNEDGTEEWVLTEE